MADERQTQDAAQQPPTIVQSFSADLDSMFGLDTGASQIGVGQLEQTVEEKKQNVTTGHQHLQELEARLRETEERLAKVSRGNSPARQANTGAPSAETAERAQVGGQASGSSLLASKPTHPTERPTGGRPQNTREDTQTLMAGMPGAMPQTPRQYGNNGDYVMVDRNTERPTDRGYGQSVR